MWKEDNTGGKSFKEYRSQEENDQYKDKIRKEIHSLTQECLWTEENLTLGPEAQWERHKEEWALKNRDTIETQEEGYKEREGKVDYSEINLNILDLAAERFTANKHKYPKGNMLKPLDKLSLVWASFRHIKKMIKPPTDDPETFKEHLSAIVCNMSMILDQLEREEKNKLIDEITR